MYAAKLGGFRTVELEKLVAARLGGKLLGVLDGRLESFTLRGGHGDDCVVLRFWRKK